MYPIVVVMLDGNCTRAFFAEAVVGLHDGTDEKSLFSAAATAARATILHTNAVANSERHAGAEVWSH